MVEEKALIVENIGDGRCRVFIPRFHAPTMRTDPELRKFLPLAEVASPIMSVGGQYANTGMGASLIAGTWVWIALDAGDPQRPIIFAQAGDGPFRNAYQDLDGRSNLNRGKKTNTSESCDSDETTGQTSGSPAQTSPSEWSSDFYGNGTVVWKPTPSYEHLNVMGIADGYTRETSFGPITRNMFDCQMRTLDNATDTIQQVDNGGMLRNAHYAMHYLDKSMRPWSETDPERIMYDGKWFTFSELQDGCKYVYAAEPSTTQSSGQNSGQVSGTTKTVDQVLIYYLRNPDSADPTKPKPTVVPETCEPGDTVPQTSPSVVSNAWKAGRWFLGTTTTTTSTNTNGNPTTKSTYTETLADTASMILVRPSDDPTVPNCNPGVCDTPSIITLSGEDYFYYGDGEDGAKIYVPDPDNGSSLEFLDDQWTFYFTESAAEGVPINSSEISCDSGFDSRISRIPDSAVDNKYLANQYGVLVQEEMVTFDKTISFTPMFTANPQNHMISFVFEPVPIFDDEDPKEITTPSINDMKYEVKTTVDTYAAYRKLSGPGPLESKINSELINVSWNYKVYLQWSEILVNADGTPRVDSVKPEVKQSDSGAATVATPSKVKYLGVEYEFTDFVYDQKDNIIGYQYGTIYYKVEDTSWYQSYGDEVFSSPASYPVLDASIASTDKTFENTLEVDVSKYPGQPIVITKSLAEFGDGGPTFKISFECTKMTNSDGKPRKICAGYAAANPFAMFFSAPVARLFEYTAVSMLENNLWRMGMNIDFSAEPKIMTAQLQDFFSALNCGQTFQPYIPRETSSADVSDGTKLIAAPEVVIHGDKVVVINADMIILNSSRLCMNAESIGILAKDYNVVSSSMPKWNDLDDSNSYTNTGQEAGTV